MHYNIMEKHGGRAANADGGGVDQPWYESDPVAFKLFEHAATTASKMSVAPYSNTYMGAAGITVDGSLVNGFNLETASWSVTVHAEVALLVNWVQLQNPLTHILCATSSRKLATPCGQCRQVLMEYFGGGLLVATGAGWTRLSSLLPEAFTAKDLE